MFTFVCYIFYRRVNAQRITMASAVVDLALVYVFANLFFRFRHVDTDTFRRRSVVSRRTRITFVSGLQINALHSGITGFSQLAFVFVETIRAVADVSRRAWATSSIEFQN